MLHKHIDLENMKQDIVSTRHIIKAFLQHMQQMHHYYPYNYMQTLNIHKNIGLI